jgi:type II secretory pathway component PulM
MRRQIANFSQIPRPDDRQLPLPEFPGCQQRIPNLREHARVAAALDTIRETSSSVAPPTSSDATGARVLRDNSSDSVGLTVLRIGSSF